MKKYILKYTSALLLILCMGVVSCDNRDDEITKLNLDRVLTPYQLKSELANITELTLTWKAIEGAEGYVVELYTDEQEFKEENFYYKGEVSTNVFMHNLQGDTQFSVRVKAVSTTTNDSKWSSGITFTTGFKSMFLQRQDGDLTHNSILFRWPAGMKATQLILTTSDGQPAAQHTVTTDEISQGIAQITALTENTRYTATLYNGDTRLGVMDVTTLIDVGDAIVVNDKDELVAKLAAANDGDLFFLKAGVYDVDEALVITKSITITGDEGNKPVLRARFDLNNLNRIEFKNLILDGTLEAGGMHDYPFAFKVSDKPYGDIIMEDLVIKNYGKTFISAGSSFVTTVAALTINNCIVGNIEGISNDVIDVRNGLIENISITNSTFYNVSPTREFIRMDGKISGGAPNILIENSTIDKVSTASGKRFLYIQYKSATYTIKKTIFSNMAARLLNASSDSFVGENNNYYEADAAKKNDKGTYSEQNPEYLNPGDGDFTVGNASITVGDPRWLKTE